MGRHLSPAIARTIEALDDEVLYSPSLVARKGVEMGLITESAYLNSRHSLVIFARNHFHETEEVQDFVYLPGQKPVPGWYGWLWKRHAIRKPLNPQAILDTLGDGEMSVSALHHAHGCAWSTTLAHVRRLEKAGEVITRKTRLAILVRRA